MAAKPIKISILADAGRAKRELDSFSSRTSSRIKGLAKNVTKVGVASVAGLLGTALWKGGQRLVGIEQAEAKLKGLGHSSKSVEGLMDNAMAAVKGTAFGFADAATAAASASAAGIKSGKEMTQYLTTIGDAAAITGRDYNEMGAIFNKVNANTKLSMAEVNQIQDAGVPILTRLAKHYGVATAEMSKMVSKGEVDAKTFNKVMEKTVGGSAQKMGKTFTGSMANIQAALGRLGASALSGVFKQLPSLINGGTKALDRLGPAAEKAGQAAGKALAGGVRTAQKFLREHRAEISQVASALRDKAAKAFDIAKRALGYFVDGMRDGTGLGGQFVMAVKGLATAAGFAASALEKLVGFLDGLPTPVKELAVQAGIAALVLPRLAAGITSAKTAATGFAANLRSAEKRTAALGAATRNVAGVGGMLLLAQGAQTSNTALKTLANVGGGAMLGFSTGGPVGAAIGGTVAALGSLLTGANRAKEAAFKSTSTWETYASTLDQVTGATTRATKAMVIQDLQQSGLLKKAGQLGISQSTLVNGILGQKKARENLAAAIGTEEAAIAALRDEAKTSGTLSQGERGILVSEAKSRENLVKAIKGEVGERKKATQTKREELLLLQDFPDAVITKVQTPGAVSSKRDLAQLAATYKLTPKQVQTIIKMNGIKASKKEVLELAESLKKTGKAKPAPDWQKALAQGLTQSRKTTKGSTGDINALLGGTGRNTKPSLGGFRSSLSGQLNGLVGTAHGKGNAIGAAIASGTAAGIRANTGAAIGAAIAMAGAAERGAKNRLGVKSPSRVFAKIGKHVVQGFVRGVRKEVKNGAAGVAAALGRVTKLVEKGITGKNQAKREKAALKRLRARFKQLRRNGNAQERINKKLADAKSKLQELREEYKGYAAAIKDSIIASGDVTQLGRQEDDSVSITSLINDLQQKANNAARFDVLMKKLAKQGLSRTSIQQMLDAGPDAALATAEAIESGGKAAITEINALQKQLADSGTSLSKSMADKYYGAGVAAAQGVVRGLEAQAKNLDKQAVKLANALVKAVKKALKIKSPSRVFQGIGDNVVKGLDIGVDDTRARRIGSVFAGELEKGFGTPALDAYARQVASDGGPQEMRVRFTAEQVSRLQRGKEVIADVDFALAAGVRTTQRWG